MRVTVSRERNQTPILRKESAENPIPKNLQPWVQLKQNDNGTLLQAANSEFRKMPEQYFDPLMLFLNHPNLHIHTFDCSDIFLLPKGTKYLANALKNNNSIRVINLSHNYIGNEGAKYIGEALKINSSLRSLDLSQNSVDATSWRGLQYILKALKINSTVHTLNLSHNTLTEKDSEAISKLLMTNTSITSINLSNNSIQRSTYISQMLKVNTSLRLLDLSFNGVDEKHLSHLLEALEINSSLQILNLQGHNLWREGVNAICEAIKMNRSLRSLCFSFTSFTLLFEREDARKILAQAIEVNSTIYSLQIFVNWVGSKKPGKTMRCISDALKVNKNLLFFKIGQQTWRNELLSFPIDNDSKKIVDARRKAKIFWACKMNYLARVMFWGERSDKMPTEMIYHILSSLSPKEILGKEEKRRIVRFACNEESLGKQKPLFIQEIFWIDIHQVHQWKQEKEIGEK